LRWLVFLLFFAAHKISPISYLMYHGNKFNGSVFGLAFLSISGQCQFHKTLSMRLPNVKFQTLRPPGSDSSPVRLTAPLLSDPMAVHFV
jgi:hypothetical protein